MKNFDFEVLETMRELAIEDSPSSQAERSELLREYVDEMSEATTRSLIAPVDAGELLDVVSNMIDFSGDATGIGQSVLATIEYGLDAASSVQEAAEELLALVQRLVDLSAHSNDAAETLMMLVRGTISE
jgi:hypothetical protein